MRDHAHVHAHTLLCDSMCAGDPVGYEKRMRRENGEIRASYGMQLNERVRISCMSFIPTFTHSHTAEHYISPNLLGIFLPCTGKRKSKRILIDCDLNNAFSCTAFHLSRSVGLSLSLSLSLSILICPFSLPPTPPPLATIFEVRKWERFQIMVDYESQQVILDYFHLL